MASQNAKTVILVAAAIIVAVVGYIALTTRENRTVGEKVDAAISKLDSGVDDAARELKDRTPAEKIKDEIKDATDGNAK